MTERIKPLEKPFPADVSGELAAMMPPGVEPLRLFRALARNPRILRKVRASNLLDRGSLERQDRELAILRTCARCGSEYEWGVHVSVFARRYGLSEEQISGTLFADAEDPRWSPAQGRIVALVDALHDEADVSDTLWSGLRDHFDESQAIELLVLIGFYHTISFVTNALRIDAEPGAEPFPATG